MEIIDYPKLIYFYRLGGGGEAGDKHSQTDISG